jgi:hypothetical protein
MDAEGVCTIPFSRNARDLQAPILGRRFHHTKGKDILVYRVCPLGRGEQQRDFYTELVEKRAEFRVWVFRDKHLATYEKVLTYPDKNGKRGRNLAIWNWDNGYAFEFRRDIPAVLKGLAKQAVAAMELDFGAVDVLQDRDGHFYVLEVNTAPGTQGEARQGITSLVANIEKWAKTGFPERG